MSAEASRVTSIKITVGPHRPRPAAGDRRTTRKHGEQVRVLARAKDHAGRPIGLLLNNGRQVYDWVPLGDLEPWDRHYLAPEERNHYFPPEPAVVPPHDAG